MDLNCPHFIKCSGCTKRQHLECPAVYEDAKLFFTKHATIPLKLHLGPPHGWRCRAKLATRGSFTHPLIGLFEEGTHHVIDIPYCKVHHPAINCAVEVLRKWIISEKIELYDESSGKGLLRYVQLTVERQSQKVQLVLVWNQSEKDELSPLLTKQLEKLWSNHIGGWHSIWMNFNIRRDNVIFGKSWRKILGEKWLWESLCGRMVCFHPASFVQANLEMFEHLLDVMEPHVPQGSNLADFYAGVGAIGLSVLERCGQVRCVEIVPQAEECFNESCKRLPEELRGRISFVKGSAGESAELIDQGVDTLIADPPRKGLDTALLQAIIASSSLKRLIYVSCGWESFKRDCNRLIENKWKLSHAEAFLFFPGSDHIETLAIFDTNVMKLLPGCDSKG